MFKGLSNLANLGALLKSAQQMESKLEGVREELKQQRVTGAAGGDMVSVEANGLGEVLACRIDPSLIQVGDRELLEDLLPAAINQALAKSKELHANALKSMTAGLNLSGLDDVVARLTGGDQEGDGTK